MSRSDTTVPAQSSSSYSSSTGATATSHTPIHKASACTARSSSGGLATQHTASQAANQSAQAPLTNTIPGSISSPVNGCQFGSLGASASAIPTPSVAASLSTATPQTFASFVNVNATSINPFTLRPATIISSVTATPSPSGDASRISFGASSLPGAPRSTSVSGVSGSNTASSNLFSSVPRPTYAISDPYGSITTANSAPVFGSKVSLFGNGGTASASAQVATGSVGYSASKPSSSSSQPNPSTSAVTSTAQFSVTTTNSSSGQSAASRPTSSTSLTANAHRTGSTPSSALSASKPLHASNASKDLAKSIKLALESAKSSIYYLLLPNIKNVIKRCALNASGNKRALIDRLYAHLEQLATRRPLDGFNQVCIWVNQESTALASTRNRRYEPYQAPAPPAAPASTASPSSAQRAMHSYQKTGRHSYNSSISTLDIAIDRIQPSSDSDSYQRIGQKHVAASSQSSSISPFIYHTFRQDPFRASRRILRANDLLNHGSSIVELPISREVVDEVTQNGLRIVMFCGRAERGQGNGGAVIDYVEYPYSIQLQVNGREVSPTEYLILRDDKSWIRPADLTKYLTLSPGVRNIITLACSLRNSTQYVFNIQLVKVNSVDDIVRSVQTSANHKSTLPSTAAPTEDDEVQASVDKITLRDPLSMCRISVPVKFRTCTHIQCFDLATFLTLHQHTAPAEYKCSVCYQKMTSWSDIAIDALFVEILGKVADTVDKVEIHPDKSWNIPTNSADAPNGGGGRKRLPGGLSAASAASPVVKVMDEDIMLVDEVIASPVAPQNPLSSTAAAVNPVDDHDVIDLTMTSDEEDARDEGEADDPLRFMYPPHRDDEGCQCATCRRVHRHYLSDDEGAEESW